MITLHYDGLNGRNEDLNEVVFSSYESFMFWLYKLDKRDDKKTVYLFASEYDDRKDEHDESIKHNLNLHLKDCENNYEKEIIIENNFTIFYNIIHNLNLAGQDDLNYNFFLQEYDSFEEAYRVALNMREPNPLCYAPE